MSENIKSLEIKNSQKSVVNFWLFIGFIGIVGLFYGFSNFDMNSWDGAIIMLSFFMIIASIICVLIFNKRANALDRAIVERKFISHFKYSSDEWNKYKEREHKFRLEEKAGIFKLLTFITVPIFLITILVVEEAKLEMFYVLCALILLYGFMAFILPHITYYFNKSSEGNVIIMEKGVLLNKEFHSWDFPMSKFTSAKISKSPFEHLEIVYEFWDRTGPRKYIVNVPIPKKSEVSIPEVISKLEEANPSKKRKGKK